MKGLIKIDTSVTQTKKIGFKFASAVFVGGVASVVPNITTQVAHAATVQVQNNSDTVKSIAQANHVSADDLAFTNHINTSSKLTKGEKLDLPKTYTVKKGDTVSEIADNLNIKTNDLLKANDLSWQNAIIKIGEKLNLPTNDEDNSTTNTANNVTNTSESQATTQTNSVGQQAANLALQYANQGIPYVWGGKTPSGFDCSGLTSYVYSQLGKNIGSNTVAQESAVSSTDVSSAAQVEQVAQPGDLLFYGSHGASYHVAIYVGNGKMVAAPQPGQNVSIESVSAFTPNFVGHVN